jgi:hypothetical protein
MGSSADEVGELAHGQLLQLALAPDELTDRRCVFLGHGASLRLGAAADDHGISSIS